MHRAVCLMSKTSACGVIVVASIVCKAPHRLFLPWRLKDQELRGFLLAEMLRRPSDTFWSISHLGSSQCYHSSSPRSHGK